MKCTAQINSIGLGSCVLCLRTRHPTPLLRVTRVFYEKQWALSLPAPLNWPLWGLGLPHPVPASKASTKWLWVEFLPPPFLWRLGRVPRAVITTAIKDNTTAIEKSAAVKYTTFVGPGPFALPSGCPWV